MKDITWNLGYWQHTSIQDDAWRYIREEIKPDLALLLEVKPSTLEDDEHIHFIPIHREWGTAINSRSPPIVERSFEGYPGRVAWAACTVNGDEINSRAHPFELNETWKEMVSKSG